MENLINRTRACPHEAADPSRGAADAKRPLKTCSNAWLRVQFIAALETVDATGAALTAALEAGHGVHASWFWTPPPPEGEVPEDPQLDADALAARARRILANIRYHAHEDRSKNPEPMLEERAATRRRFAVQDLAPGIIAAAPELLARVDAFNAARATLTPLLEEMNRADRKVTDADDRSGEHLGKPFLRYVLKWIDCTDLNLHRARRQLPRLQETPLRMGFTWAISRRIRRIALEAVLARLDALRSATEDLSARVHADIAIMRTLLAEQPDDPPPLAYINAPHRNPKLNVLFPGADGGPPRRQLIRTVLPVFYPDHEGCDLLPFTRLKPLPDDTDIEDLDASPILGADGKLKRRDTAYEHSRQLLQTLPVYAHREVVARFRAPLRNATGTVAVAANANED